MTSAIAPHWSPRARTGMSGSPDLPPDVLQTLVAEVRRHIPDCEASALRSLDRLTSFVVTTSHEAGRLERQSDGIGTIAGEEANLGAARNELDGTTDDQL